MKTLPALLAFAFFTAFICYQKAKLPLLIANRQPAFPSDSLLYQRFSPPSVFERTPAASSSFAYYLRHLPLKPVGSSVLFYDGRKKANPNIYEAVVNLPIGTKDLHQCADAVIRLRAEYLWRTHQYDHIHFNLTNGFRVGYERWRKGERVKVLGNATSWQQTAAISNTYATFWAYLEFVFNYAGTLSLSKELQTTPISDMQIGDVFIQGGSPDHAVIVVDIAINTSGKKMFLLAQSYMPAQEIQILKNPQGGHAGAWYSDDFGEVLHTPQWNFSAKDLKRF